MPPSELEWYNNFTDSICDYVENQIQIGNTQTAYRIAMESKSGIRNNPNVRYRIDSYKQYCDDMQNHGYTIIKMVASHKQPMSGSVLQIHINLFLNMTYREI